MVNENSGLIFIAQKKIESYNAELVHLRENQDKITAEALQVKFQLLGFTVYRLFSNKKKNSWQPHKPRLMP